MYLVSLRQDTLTLWNLLPTALIFMCASSAKSYKHKQAVGIYDSSVQVSHSKYHDVTQLIHEQNDTNGTSRLHLERLEKPMQQGSRANPTTVLAEYSEKLSKDSVGIQQMEVVAYLGQRLGASDDGKELIANAFSSSRAMKIFEVWNKIPEDVNKKLALLGGDAGGAGVTESEAAKIVLCLQTELNINGENKTVSFKNESYRPMWTELTDSEKNTVFEVFGDRSKAIAWAKNTIGHELAAVLEEIAKNEKIAQELIQDIALRKKALQSGTAKAIQDAKQALHEAERKKQDLETRSKLAQQTEWDSDWNTHLSARAQSALKPKPKERANQLAEFEYLLQRSWAASVYFDKRSRFTFTNAAEMFKLLIGIVIPKPINAKIHLVSNAHHLPRARYIFEAVLAIGRQADMSRSYDKYREMYMTVKTEAKAYYNTFHDAAQLGVTEIQRDFFDVMKVSQIQFVDEEVPDKKTVSTVENYKGWILVHGPGLKFDPSQGMPNSMKEGPEIRTCSIQDSKTKEWEQFSFATFSKDVLDFNGDYCRLSPSIWKDTNAFNRLEVIDWNLRMLMTMREAYAAVDDSFAVPAYPQWKGILDEEGKERLDKSWCDDEMAIQGGMTIPNNPIMKGLVKGAMKSYVAKAKEYYTEFKERLSPKALHEADILCPQTVAALKNNYDITV